MKHLIRSTLAALSLAAALPVALAADVTLRFHQFLPAQGNVPALAIDPWARKVEKDSGGRIKVQHFPSMQLGGRPPDLFDQARDGVVDLAWIVMGFTPGRFPKTEAFELPFTVGAAVPGSRAFHEFVRTHAIDEFKDVKLITVHVHGPGIIHSKDPVRRLEDLRGMKIRGGSRTVNMMLEQLGATPVGMPVTSIGESLSKGVIEATTIPFEVVPSLRLHQIVRNHTAFSGEKGLYTLTFAVVMNQKSYDRLPPDLQKVIDANSGAEAAALFGRAMATGDETGRATIEKAGNTIIRLDPAETQRFARVAAGVRAQWFRQVAEKGINGPKLASEAERLIEKYQAGAR